MCFFFIAFPVWSSSVFLLFSPREPAGKLALGYKQEASNHMLDIFKEGVCVHV